MCNVPDHSLKLLLADVRRHFAVYLTRAERHGQGFRHIGLDLRRYRGVLVGGADPDAGCTLVLEFTGSDLGDFGA